MSKYSGLEMTLKQSGSYQDWMETARTLDELDGKDRGGWNRNLGTMCTWLQGVG